MERCIDAAKIYSATRRDSNNVMTNCNSTMTEWKIVPKRDTKLIMRVIIIFAVFLLEILIFVI